jgi:hypothetical protein
MLMNERTAFEVVMRERHAGRMKIASVPARKRSMTLRTLVSMNGMGVLPARDSSSGWRKSRINPKTRGVYLRSPQNPRLGGSLWLPK